MENHGVSRRQLLKLGTGAALAAGTGLPAWAAEPAAKPVEMPAGPRGKADACIFLWLGGGASHIDTLDPKARGDGQKKPGSFYDSIPTAIPGARVCEHLK